MTTSTNEDLNGDRPPQADPDPVGGGLADALTILRIVVTPVIMALIVWGWPDPQVAILASFLFLVAAIADILDDWFGGSARSTTRRYGYLDDAADTILFAGVLVALTVVIARNGMLHWAYLVPVAVLVVREVVVGLVKGYELSRFGWPDNPLSNAKGGFAMLGTLLLVASPWVTQWLDRMRAGTDRAMDVYNSGSPAVWIAGQVCLWIAALFSIWSGYLILTGKRAASVSETGLGNV
ncbi:MAG: CDP-alcohol phosphatidyltransferase family protein [Pseudomonadota bacterium]